MTGGRDQTSQPRPPPACQQHLPTLTVRHGGKGDEACTQLASKDGARPRQWVAAAVELEVVADGGLGDGAVERRQALAPPGGGGSGGVGLHDRQGRGKGADEDGRDGGGKGILLNVRSRTNLA